MKTQSITAALLTLAAFATTGAAHAAGGEAWYGGLKVGRGVEHLGGGEVDDALGNQGLGTSSSIDRASSSYSIFGGYRFNDNFAVEGGYNRLGRFATSSSIGSPAADTASGHYEAHGVDLSGVGMVPFGAGFSGFGKAGLAYEEAKLDVSSDSGANMVSSTHHWGVSPLLGAGVGYRLNLRTELRAEYDRYFRVGDESTGRGNIDQYSVGVAVHF